MALKLIIDKLEDVDETLRSLYAEKDGKFALQVDGIEDTTGLRSALGKERHARAELEKKVKKWEAIGKTDEEIADLISKHEETQISEAERKGEWDKLKAQMNEKHAAELKKKDVEIAALNDREGKRIKQIESHLVDANATAAIASLKGVSELLLPHVRKHVKVEEVDGEFKVKVVDGKGDPRVNGKGDPLSISELVAEMRSNEIFGRAFEGSGNTGSGTRPGGTPPGGPGSPARRSDFKGDNKAIAAYVDAHGLDAYKALPI